MLTITPLHRDVAACIEGVNLASGLSSTVHTRIKRAFRQHAVLIFRAQGNLSREQFRGFAAIFGKPSNCDDITNLDVEGNILDPSDINARYAKGNTIWHMDVPFIERPPLASLLLARELPSGGGGQTQFVDLAAAWRSLLRTRKVELRKLRAIHDLETARRKVGITDPTELKSPYSAGEHPLVSVDPISGKETLYFSAHTVQIKGKSKEQSDALIDSLFRESTREASIYPHSWQPYDLLIWANRRTLHRVLPFDEKNAKRRLWRAEVLADQPPMPAAWWQRSVG